MALEGGKEAWWQIPISIVSWLMMRRKESSLTFTDMDVIHLFVSIFVYYFSRRNSSQYR